MYDNVREQRWKVQLKPRVKAYLVLAPVLFDFVYRSRIWFATNSDLSTWFVIVVNYNYDLMYWVFSKRKEKDILFGRNDRN